MRALSDILWHQRDLLDVLAHRLEIESLLLSSGRTKRLSLAARETQSVLEETRTAELARATEVVAAASLLGLTPTASLAEIAAAAPPPWDEIFTGHREALLELVDEINAQNAPPVTETLADELAGDDIDLQLDVIGRKATEARGRLVHADLIDFLR